MLHPSGLLYPIPASFPALGFFPAPVIPTCHCQKIIPKYSFYQVPRFLKTFFFPKWLKLSPNSACLWKFPIPWELPPFCLPQGPPHAHPIPWQSVPHVPRLPTEAHTVHPHTTQIVSLILVLWETHPFTSTSWLNLPRTMLVHIDHSLLSYFLWSVPHNLAFNTCCLPRSTNCFLYLSFIFSNSCKQLEGRDHTVHFSP